MAQRFQSEYPFAEYRLATEGVHVLMDFQQVEPDSELRRLIVADSSGQVAWRELIGQRLAQFEYEDELAVVWHLAGDESPVTIDPRVAFGAPTVRGIPTWVIRGRWEAGEGIEEIRSDFALEEWEVESALAFEGAKKAA
ncbi:MAG: DUF433 domain-containing protein [Dehalococcoidia bacterium]|nr:DUF433 domain-containing protein [Dehalococcoidia bacterium]